MRAQIAAQVGGSFLCGLGQEQGQKAGSVIEGVSEATRGFYLQLYEKTRGRSNVGARKKEQVHVAGIMTLMYLACETSLFSGTSAVCLSPSSRSCDV